MGVRAAKRFRIRRQAAVVPILIVPATLLHMAATFAHFRATVNTCEKPLFSAKISCAKTECQNDRAGKGSLLAG